MHAVLECLTVLKRVREHVRVPGSRASLTRTRAPTRGSSAWRAATRARAESPSECAAGRPARADSTARRAAPNAAPAWAPRRTRVGRPKRTRVRPSRAASRRRRAGPPGRSRRTSRLSWSSLNTIQNTNECGGNTRWIWSIVQLQWGALCKIVHMVRLQISPLTPKCRANYKSYDIETIDYWCKTKASSKPHIRPGM